MLDWSRALNFEGYNNALRSDGYFAVYWGETLNENNFGANTEMRGALHYSRERTNVNGK